MARAPSSSYCRGVATIADHGSRNRRHSYISKAHLLKPQPKNAATLLARLA